MGQRSSRIYLSFNGKDHKEIYLHGKYHDKMYIGSELVWEKLSGEIEDIYFIPFYSATLDEYYVISNFGKFRNKLFKGNSQIGYLEIASWDDVGGVSIYKQAWLDTTNDVFYLIGINYVLNDNNYYDGNLIIQKIDLNTNTAKTFKYMLADNLDVEAGTLQFLNVEDGKLVISFIVTTVQGCYVLFDLDSETFDRIDERLEDYSNAYYYQDPDGDVYSLKTYPYEGCMTNKVLGYFYQFLNQKNDHVILSFPNFQAKLAAIRNAEEKSITFFNGVGVEQHLTGKFIEGGELEQSFDYEALGGFNLAFVSMDKMFFTEFNSQLVKVYDIKTKTLSDAFKTAFKYNDYFFGYGRSLIGGAENVFCATKLDNSFSGYTYCLNYEYGDGEMFRTPYGPGEFLYVNYIFFEKITAVYFGKRDFTKSYNNSPMYVGINGKFEAVRSYADFKAKVDEYKEARNA